MSTRLLHHLATLLLVLCSGPVLAVNYVFPTNMPAGCTGSGGNYTCPGGSLAYNDTVTISGTLPATITVNGNLVTSNARINQGGSASNLTIRVNGTLTAEYQAVINANVQATVVNGTGNEVVWGGSISTTTGALRIGYNNTVAGHLTSTSGAITIGGISQVAGNVSCSCAVELDYDARVAGTVSAASLVGDGRVHLQGSSVTTTGSVDIGYGSTLSASVTAGGTIRLRGNIQAAQCLRTSNASNLRLDWADRANGGVCCGALGSCTTSCVTNGSGAAMPALCSGSPPASAPARFNAFETATAANSITGVIRTKIAGTAFSVAVVAVNAAGTGVATTFTGNVRVEVLDASNNNGSVNATTNCNANWTVAAGTSAVTLNFAASDAGRKNVSFTVANAFPNARIRVSHPDTGTATVIGCSTDNFAIRPDRFELASGATSWATDSDWDSDGTTRALNNVNASGAGSIHKAGQPFRLRARAVNSSAVTTAGYELAPTLTRTACVGTACTATTGALNVAATAVDGVIDAIATYAETGAFNLQLTDSSFASVDAADGSSDSERTISSTARPVGRFVPDHFAFVSSTAPVLRTFGSNTCASRSFTYLGQPVGYATAPQAMVEARNALGARTTLYAKWSTATLTHTPGLTTPPSGVSIASTAATHVPTLTANAGTPGTATVAAHGSELFTLARPASTPVANFNALATLTWTVEDRTEADGHILTSAPLVFGSTGGIGFDAGAQFRYGQLRLGSAYGSELVALAVPLETQHWNGTSFVTNSADHCTVLPTSALSFANFRGSLAACETAPTGTSVSFASGRAVMRLQAPGNGNTGSVDGTVQLGTTLAPAGAVRCAAVGPSTTAALPASLPWLQGRAPGGSTYDQNPSARFSFGQYRSPLIQLREMY
jgi:hypothetical protein